MKKKAVMIVISYFLCTVLLCSCIASSPNQVNDSLTLWVRSDEIYNGNYMQGIGASIWDLKTLVQDYETQYPDVTVNVETFGDLSDEQYYKKLSAEIMGAGGPDLIFIDDDMVQYRDVYKMMNSDAFWNLDELIENDSEFDLSLYQPVVLKAGMWKENRMLFPLDIEMPILCGSEEVLSKNEIEVDTDMTAGEVLQCFGDFYRNTDEDNPPFFLRGQDGFDVTLTDYMYVMGNTIADYTTEKVTLDLNSLEGAAANYATFYDQDVDNVSWWPSESLSLGEVFRDGHWLLPKNTHWLAAKSMQAVYTEGLTPITIPLRMENGKINARVTHAVGIKKTSKNRDNAWNFMKIMLSIGGQARTPRYSSPIMTKLAKITFQTACGKDYDNRYDALPQEYVDQYCNYFDEIGGAYFYTPLIPLVNDALAPYYEGKKSFDECTADLTDRIRIYVSE